MARQFDIEPVCCGVCKRQAEGIGYAPKQGKPVLWLCHRTECISLGKTVFHMSPNSLTTFERQSLEDAGEAAGKYLESIGKFSLADLTEAEWNHFLRTVLFSYGDAMRERLLDYKAPF
ncbi:DUF6511 domain-containing protein [Rhodopseudomonas palustris]|uniref:DUF6511 domain-containing protein n=1 Tax=Rhodopseudomonas palustris TaxID=1076 RepID=UPI000641D3C0|nr:DUF6511 domain-containing protein [Rhodopseudomonas palustris]